MVGLVDVHWGYGLWLLTHGQFASTEFPPRISGAGDRHSERRGGRDGRRPKAAGSVLVRVCHRFGLGGGGN